jgi:hypothetical protein
MQHAGFTTTLGQMFDVTLVVNTSQYASGDLLSDVIEIPNAVPAVYGSGMIQSLHLSDADDEGAALDLHFTNLSTTWGTINAALAASDAIMQSVMGTVEIAADDYTDQIINKCATKTNLGIGIVGSSTGSIYVAASSRGTPTYASASDLKLRLFITY